MEYKGYVASISYSDDVTDMLHGQVVNSGNYSICHLCGLRCGGA